MEETWNCCELMFTSKREGRSEPLCGLVENRMSGPPDSTHPRGPFEKLIGSNNIFPVLAWLSNMSTRLMPNMVNARDKYLPSTYITIRTDVYMRVVMFLFKMLTYRPYPPPPQKKNMLTYLIHLWGSQALRDNASKPIVFLSLFSSV